MQPRTTRELQHWLQGVITDSGGLAGGLHQARLRYGIGENEVIARPGGASVYSRLNVYASGYFLRLYECLAADFPLLKKFLGDDVFLAFGQVFLQTVASTSYTLHDLGEKFVQYLADTRPVTEDAALNSSFNLPIELARLERLRQEVVRAKGNEDAPVAAPQGLESIFFSAARLRASPPATLRLVACAFPMKRFMQALQAGEAELPALPEPAATFMAISRKNYRLMMEELAEWQWVFLQQCARSATLQAALTATAELVNRPVGKVMAELYVWLPFLLANNFVVLEEL